MVANQFDLTVEIVWVQAECVFGRSACLARACVCVCAWVKPTCMGVCLYYSMQL